MESLASDRLRYEPLAREHFEHLFSIYREPEVFHHLLSRPTGEGDFERIFENSLHASLHHGMWAIFEAGERRLCGRVGFFEFSEAARPEIAFLFSAEYWGQGYATEACRTVLSWALSRHAWPECIALVGSGNLAALRVCAKLGMKPEIQIELREARVDLLQATRRELERHLGERPPATD